jgi:hypothetical protein
MLNADNGAKTRDPHMAFHHSARHAAIMARR